MGHVGTRFGSPNWAGRDSTSRPAVPLRRFYLTSRDGLLGLLWVTPWRALRADRVAPRNMNLSAVSDALRRWGLP